MLDRLKARLAVAIDLRSQTKHGHWNVKCPHFIALHRLLEKLVRLCGDNANHWLCLDMLLSKRADLERSTEALEHAANIYQRSLHVNPEDFGAHHNLGTALLGLKRYGESIGELMQAIKRNPNIAEAHCNLGCALERQGKVDEAIAKYKDAIRLNNRLANAYACLGNALSSQKKWSEAIAAYGEVIRHEPDSEIAHTLIGWALMRQGKTGDAIAQWKEAIRLNPNWAAAH
jgi:superkiller protein 3